MTESQDAQFNKKLKSLFRNEDWKGIIEHCNGCSGLDLNELIHWEYWKMVAYFEVADFVQAEASARKQVELGDQVELDNYSKGSILAHLAGLLTRNGKFDQARDVISKIQSDVLVGEPEQIAAMQSIFSRYAHPTNTHLWQT